jgi:peptidoglycan hydrolase-like protein with peptidoglycan-binding domain
MTETVTPAAGPDATTTTSDEQTVPPSEPSRRPKWRRVPWKVAVPAAALVVVAGGASVIAASGGDSSTSGSSISADTATAQVSKRTLVDRETLSGSLGYEDQRNVPATRSGTVTWMAAEGSTKERGQILYRVDNSPTYLMYGSVPVYRPLNSSVGNGPDVRQLEANLRALGYDEDKDMDVDNNWDSATTAAVELWQDARGATQTGAVSTEEIVFLPDAQRIGSQKATLGQRTVAGQPVLVSTTTTRAVTVDLDARRTDLVSAGASARVTLPDGSRVDGTVSEIGATATAPKPDADPTVEVTVRLADKAKVTSFDQAPVDVEIAKEIKKGVLSVPVLALLALKGGGYGVERVNDDGSTTIVSVTPGVYADGFVEVSGEGVTEGSKVVTAT